MDSGREHLFSGLRKVFAWMACLLDDCVDMTPAATDAGLLDGSVGCCWCVGQVVKGARWMPGHQEPMKDVGGRDRPRGAVNRAVIRGCPNGVTRQPSWAVTPA